MANGQVQTLSRLGQINGANATDALFLKVFANEILTTFEELNVMKNLHTVRTIQSGKSAQFPVTGIATANYHTPGDDILETSGYSSQIKHAERVINIDDVLLAATFIPNIDEMKNHYDVRSIYATELGKALAKRFDIATMKTLIAAARTNKAITDAGFAGEQIELGSGNELTTAGELIEVIQDIAQKFDEKDVPSDERFVLMKPAQYYKLIGANTDAVSFDLGSTNGAGYSRLENPLITTGVTNLASNRIASVAGISIIKTNHLPSTDLSSTSTGDGASNNDVFDDTLPHDASDGNFDVSNTNGYNGNFSKTILVAGHKSAIGTVKLMDLATESEYIMTKQGTAMVAKYAMGHGVLRPECAIEVVTHTA